jgi:hypothetical protein
LLFNEEEVGLSPIADVGEDALIDLVGIGDNADRLCLTEDARQTDDWYCTEVDDVAEHVASSHTGSCSMSPTSIRRIDSGTAFNSEFIRMISIIDDSSTISTSPSSGFSSLRP